MNNNGRPSLLFNSGLNTLGDNAYFIRLTDNKKCFICYEGETLDGEFDKYIVREGIKGACIFTLENAINFCMQSNANNIEPVKVLEILGNDGSLN